MTALPNYGEQELSDLLARIAASGIGHFELHTPAMSLQVDARRAPAVVAVSTPDLLCQALRSPRVGVLHWRVEQDGTHISEVISGGVAGEIDVAGTRVQIVADIGGTIERQVDEGTFVEYGEIVATLVGKLQ